MSETEAAVIGSREALLAMWKPKTKIVKLPDDAGFIMLRALTVTEADSVRNEVKVENSENKEDQPRVVDSFGERLLLRSIVDSKGNLIFSKDDLSMIKQSSNSPIDFLVGEVLMLNGFKKAPAEKNSETTPTEDSATV